MTSVAVLGATGNPGGQVAVQIVGRGRDLSVAVQSAGRLSHKVADYAPLLLLFYSKPNADTALCAGSLKHNDV